MFKKTLGKVKRHLKGKIERHVSNPKAKKVLGTAVDTTSTAIDKLTTNIADTVMHPDNRGAIKEVVGDYLGDAEKRGIICATEENKQKIKIIKEKIGLLMKEFEKDKSNYLDKIQKLQARRAYLKRKIEEIKQKHESLDMVAKDIMLGSAVNYLASIHILLDFDLSEKIIPLDSIIDYFIKDAKDEHFKKAYYETNQKFCNIISDLNNKYEKLENKVASINKKLDEKTESLINEIASLEFIYNIYNNGETNGVDITRPFPNTNQRKDENGEFASIYKECDDLSKRMDNLLNKLERLINLNPEEELEKLEKQFYELTKFDKKDYSILLVGVGLHILRQVLQPDFTDADDRLDHKEEEKLVKENVKKWEKRFGFDIESSKKQRIERGDSLYNPSYEEILCNPVPFDTNVNDRHLFRGYGKLGHRGATIGHDPLAGLIVGTANIATSTITLHSKLDDIEFKKLSKKDKVFNLFFTDSYHVFSGHNKKGNIMDVISDVPANIGTILYYTYIDKLLLGGTEGMKIIALSIYKEVVHLATDIDSKQSLPFPFVNFFNDKYAEDLYKYGIDASNLKALIKQVSLAVSVNFVIGLLHRLCAGELNETQSDMYMVKTKKIIAYATTAATSINLADVGLEMYMGNDEAWKKLDIGGLIVAIFNLVSSVKFQREMKRKFIAQEYSELLESISKDID